MITATAPSTAMTRVTKMVSNSLCVVVHGSVLDGTPAATKAAVRDAFLRVDLRRRPSPASTSKRS